MNTTREEAPNPFVGERLIKTLNQLLIERSGPMSNPNEPAQDAGDVRNSSPEKDALQRWFKEFLPEYVNDPMWNERLINLQHTVTVERLAQERMHKQAVLERDTKSHELRSCEDDLEKAQLTIARLRGNIEDLMRRETIQRGYINRVREMDRPKDKRKRDRDRRNYSHDERSEQPIGMVHGGDRHDKRWYEDD